MECLGKKVRDYKKRTNVLEINLKKKFLTSITKSSLILSTVDLLYNFLSNPFPYSI